ncbi:MAG: hypothetical protein ACFFA8_07015 [Promethearchaeota archaeon]
MLYDFIADFKEAWRIFEYDYIYFDAIFLSIWLGVLIYKKKWSAISFGIITGICVYIIDAVAWFNIPVNSSYPPGTYIREYWIGGVYIPRPLGEYFWIKFGADFMMTISYGMFAFGWLWIAFEKFKQNNYREIIPYTILYFASWFLIPYLSFWIPLNDTQIRTVRHMSSQFVLWIINVIIGYTILILIYATKRFKSKNLKVIYFVFIIGCIESFFMEFPLFITGIRPTGITFLLYEIIILFNQGAPYLYILYDKILPLLNEKILKRKQNTQEELEITAII